MSQTGLEIMYGIHSRIYVPWKNLMKKKLVCYILFSFVIHVLSFNSLIFKDEAFQNVFSGFNQATEKEILAMLDADTLKSK